MEETIYKKIAKKCLVDPVIIPLKSHEELCIHFIKENNKVYFNVILYNGDEEIHQYLFDTYYDEMLYGYMFIIFQINTKNISDIRITMQYDREQETFIFS